MTWIQDTSSYSFVTYIKSMIKKGLWTITYEYLDCVHAASLRKSGFDAQMGQSIIATSLKRDFPQ